MPFADYTDFDDCVSKNSDKENPEAYCAAIQKQAETKKVELGGKSYKIVAENVPLKISASIKKVEVK